MLHHTRSTILLLLTCLLAACGGGGDSLASNTPSAPFGAAVTLYAAAIGSGAPTVLGTATTASNGTFSFGNYVCPSSDPPLYAVLVGGDGEWTVSGNGGGGVPNVPNGAIKLMAALGACSKAPQNFYINELTTVAAVYALNAFRAVPGTINANTVGDMSQLRSANIDYLRNGFATAAQLVDVTTGTPGAFLPSVASCTGRANADNCQALATLTALANALASCVRSAGGSPACTQLFSDTNATNTLDAAMYVVRNPGLVNVQDIYNLSTQPAQGLYSQVPQPLFAPGMTAAPNDWTLGVFYPAPGYPNGASISGLAIDAQGNLWTGAGGANYSFIEFDVTGNVLNYGGPVGLSTFVSWLAFDPNQTLWLEDCCGTFSQPPSSIFAFASNGLIVPNLALGPQQGVVKPQQLAVGESGNVWVANSGNNSVSVINTQGEIANFTSSGANQLNHPGPIAIDMQGNSWIGNANGTLSAFASSGAPIANPYSGGGLNGAPTAIAADKFGNLWIAEESSTSVCSSADPYAPNCNPYPSISYGGIKKLSLNNGTLSSAPDLFTMTTSSSSFSTFNFALSPFAPAALAIDGEGTAWALISNGCFSFNNCGNGAAGVILAINGNGNLLSPSAFFTPNALNTGGATDRYSPAPTPAGFAVDGAGNVWYVPIGSPGLFALVGAAAPTVTPLYAQLQGAIASPPPSPPPANYSVSVNVSGLPSGTSVVLQDNGADNLTVNANGTVAFATTLANGASYSVSVLTQPSGANCTVSSASGTIAAGAVTVPVTCTATASGSYTLGGSIFGLIGTGLVLSDVVDQIAIAPGQTTFTFSTSIAAGTSYTVIVYQPASGQTCTVSNATGTMPAANVTNVTVGCS